MPTDAKSPSGRRNSSGRATIIQVANRADVSIGTVSRVINGHLDVDPQLRARVESAIRELDYRPNVRAQNFVRNRAPIISFILSNRAGLNPVHSLILQGIVEYCEEAGYYVLFTRWQYLPSAKAAELPLPGVLRANGLTDCAIVAGINYDNFLDALQQLGQNYVILANNLVSNKSRTPVNQVRFDDYGGSCEATRYLIQLGHKDIWYMGDTSLPWFRIRYEAYKQAMVDHFLEPREQTLALSDDPFENGHASVGLIFDRELPVTAILAGSDELAYGAMEALRQHGRDVPRDVSVIGFGHYIERMRIQNLTSVCVDSAEVGRQLAKLAVAKIKSGGRDQPEVVVPTSLVKRSTCRPFRPEPGMVL